MHILYYVIFTIRQEKQLPMRLWNPFLGGLSLVWLFFKHQKLDDKFSFLYKSDSNLRESKLKVKNAVIVMKLKSMIMLMNSFKFSFEHKPIESIYNI